MHTSLFIVPDQPVNVFFSYKDSTEVRLQWDAPIEPNGELINYLIHYWPVFPRANRRFRAHHQIPYARQHWRRDLRPRRHRRNALFAPETSSPAEIPLPANLHTFAATNLLPNTTYKFVLRAKNSAGASSPRLLYVYTSTSNRKCMKY